MRRMRRHGRQLHRPFADLVFLHTPRHLQGQKISDTSCAPLIKSPHQVRLVQVLDLFTSLPDDDFTLGCCDASDLIFVFPTRTSWELKEWTDQRRRHVTFHFATLALLICNPPATGWVPLAPLMLPVPLAHGPVWLHIRLGCVIRQLAQDDKWPGPRNEWPHLPSTTAAEWCK